MLSVFPAGFDVAAAAAVAWDGDEAGAREGLGELEARSLVLYDRERARYRLHDLMRDVAHDAFGYGEEAKDAVADERRLAEASARHAGHYCSVLDGANALYLQGGEGMLAGLALFDAERSNIDAGQRWAAGNATEDHAAVELCSRYPDAGAHVLDLRLHARDRIGWLEAALAAARHGGDRGAEGRHLGNLGSAYRELGETRRAIEFHEQDLKIAQEIGDRRAEGDSLGSLGNAYYKLGEPRRAIEFYEQNLKMVREVGDRRGEGNTLGNLGNAYANLGEPHRATEFYEQYLKIAREIGDRRGEGIALYNLANALMEVGEREQAIELAERSLEISSEIEDPNSDTVRAALARWRGGG